MEKQKRWHLYLILAVVLLTVYNILPTVFYYANPLKKPVSERESDKIAGDIINRVNSLETFTLSWLRAQTKNLGLKAKEISMDSQDPSLAKVVFKSPEDAAFFAKTLNRAGSLIPFAPAELSVNSASSTENASTVLVQRRIGVRLDPSNQKDYFHYISKFNSDGSLSEEYRELMSDRVAELALGFGGISSPAKVLTGLATDPDLYNDEIVRLARSIVEFETTFGEQSPITQRYFASFSQTLGQSNKRDAIHAFTAQLEKISKLLDRQVTSLKNDQDSLQKEGKFLDTLQQQQLEVLENQKNTLEAANTIVRRNKAIFEKSPGILTKEQILTALKGETLSSSKTQSISIGDLNPFVNTLVMDWNKEEVQILLHPDVNLIRNRDIKTELEALQQEKLNQLLFSSIAIAARTSDETIKPSISSFVVSLNQLTNSTSLLAFDLNAVAKQQTATLQHLLTNTWQPQSGELSAQEYPIQSYEQFMTLPANQQKLGLIVYSPIAGNEQEGFRAGSLYVVAKGLNSIRQKYLDLPNSPQKTTFDQEFKKLHDLLRQNGFIGYAGKASDLPVEFHNDYIFELDNAFAYLLAATREDFSVKGSKRYALLEFTDVEQRLLTLNKIQTRSHEDLLKWYDEYRTAKVSIDPQAHYYVPKPTQNVFLDNLKLSFVKYFRGDDRKILKWGLDLSGGKTVRIGLKDQNNQRITTEDDIKQAVNELYQRVNRLGVSEVNIRTEGSSIVLDFPGSQGLSAAELIQASAMYFHLVNEKFSPTNPVLSEAVNTFLDQVWNEAVITNRTDPESLNQIAWEHLGGNPEQEDDFHPLTSEARLLYENGLRLAGANTANRSNAFDDTYSSIALFRGNDYAEWQGQTNPLLFVFRNYALEGSSLIDVHTSYDPSEGNVLNFGVRSAYTNKEGEKINPRDDFYAWTSHFSEEQIQGTPLETYSQGRGWRMAVILNGSVISAPTLNAPLRDSARITGRFSQREINQLAADLKAGSLSFTPFILSEENVSPDLGKEQRIQGILAATLGLVLVMAIMCSYYRFSGLIASLAVIFNLLIIWGVLQNLGAALTLPGLAGIILAIGMSVDANVLVFERIREEFALSRRLPSAIQAGYRKAFSAIVDSNLTTIIAAVILLNFDAGPIKGFALTLIIGIVSSMFTALFMTRFFFSRWVQNPQHKELKMTRLFGETKFNFLAKSKLAFLASIIVMVIGLLFLFSEKQTIFGMDFTGGYSLTLDLSEKPDTDYREEVKMALIQGGLAPSDFQIKELNKPNQLRIQLGVSTEQSGKPFYKIDESPLPPNPLFTYQEYPRIAWIVQALENKGLEINPTSLPTLNLHWTQMSGQLSETMRNQALIGLGIALLCILIYITFRFEFKFATSATLALAHDLLISIGLLAILHHFFEGIQIDLQVIAALMTIVGYSLNDTIIIFDRIREDTKLLRKLSYAEIINHALNATLSRTIMTSGTTLAVLIALVLFGGPSIFNFSLIMLLGVAIGTFSSIYIAAPLLLYFHQKEERREQESVSPSKA